ncbi:cytoskeletal protein CcmA (bactofilin family) [Paenibacillus taihuensis]|uniref:Cytoskeletal protein CcmA (Bactofilin family) n=1 Tax=Paenibacillus taihuensis TaxID=1156355 RepID=A0A3D9SMK7_9BACL|nr:polymer-forming cytoskeletal protein [Paenibacillus taihuensis]REE92794.1 cytoskeletal protein CcmA (bactofilin family) [Paenibacillus taihuensis]
MFREAKRSASAETLIGHGTHVEGKLICEHSIRIEGEYRGDIECKGEVIIGEYGVARSSITAQDLTIAGRVHGDIVVKGRLTITASGQLFGNVLAHTMLIQDGGIYNGNCRMERQTEPRTRQLPENEASTGQQAQQQAKEKARQAG